MFCVVCWVITVATVTFMADCHSSGRAPDGAPLVLCGASPHAIGDPVVERPGQASGFHRAAPADPLRLVNLAQRGSSRANREEQIRIGVAAGRFVTPVRGSGHR